MNHQECFHQSDRNRIVLEDFKKLFGFRLFKFDLLIRSLLCFGFVIKPLCILLYDLFLAIFVGFLILNETLLRILGLN